LSDAGLIDAVSDYACAIVGCASERIIAVERFADGNRHAVHRVCYLDANHVTRDAVVRISYGGDAADRAQAEREAAALRAVAGVAGPMLYDWRLTSQWFDTPSMCMQLLPGRQRTLNTVTPAEIGRLAWIVAWVHERATDDLVPPLEATADIAVYAHDRLQSIGGTLEWARDPLPTALQAQLRQAWDRLAERLEELQDGESLRTGEPLRLLHGDIADGNVLWGPAPALIDWEYTRLGDVADELAYLFDQNALTDPQRNAFWEGYQRGARADARLDCIRERVQWWEPMTLVGSALWWIERWIRRTELDAVGAIDDAVARDAGYYFDHITRRLARLRTLMAGR
jgi:aminoglycoside phosphotransferase (APT) family kinase protein